VLVEPARSIGKLGFRRWYERRLIESHAWLVTAFLCLVGMAAVFEAFSFSNRPLQVLLAVAFIFAAGLVGWHALQRVRCRKCGFEWTLS
jgi:multisubunit Na+/H+ antiporter MnhG subunit